ncbi:unnamed protein product [Caenorhabditis bovis]|uniref:CRAL-TRIO domain-containing protein n=1 Tax=Caenorhabditis bovis TaxID=2654633 RepID=A0A8S1F8I1_9PELO|nr:unnamed protein product [Caenorhabditis bovis]
MASSQISQTEREKINKLRTLVKDALSEYYDTDFNLLRWLQGHNSLSIEEVAKKLRHHLNLRNSTWNLDEMHKADRNHKIHHHWKYGITGKSGILENVIVNIEQCGKTDYSGMMESYSVSEVMRARLVDLEQMLAAVMKVEKETGKQASILYVMDITGLEYNKKLYDLVTGSMKSLADFMADHYVEMIKFFVPVCVPSFAYALYTVVRPLLPEKTKDKVRLISEHQWREEILNYAQIDSLPCTWNDDNHKFPAKIDLPVPYPLDGYYSAKNLKPPPNTESITVVAGKAHVLTKFLKKGDILKWWVRGNRNFGFGVFWSEDENVADFFIAKQAFPSFLWMPGPTIVPLEDLLTVPKDAYYHIWVSNERSWWFSLNAHLAVDIISIS